jgi:hypothetical protein
MEVKPNLIRHKGVKNSEARYHVNKHHDFITDNETIEGRKIIRNRDSIYIVYSYGVHYPMYVYDYETGKWLGNKDKNSRTTEQHKKHARPNEEIHAWYDTYTLQRIITHGWMKILTNRLEGATV